MNNNDLKPATQKSSGLYVALGDSVAAGIGAGEYTDSSACNRTQGAYPNIIARDMNMTLRSFACSAATVPAGISGAQTVNKSLVQPQLDALFELGETPELITITIGANDANWTQLLARCYSGSCGSDDDANALQASLANARQNLVAALQRIDRQYTAAKPQILVTGYYQIFATSTPSSCIDVTGLDASKLAFGRELQAAINDTVRSAVQQAQVGTYIEIDFTSHELCSGDPWIQGLTDAEPYHPNAAGQRAIADQIKRGIKK